MTTIITHLIALAAGAAWAAWRLSEPQALQDHTHASQGRPRLRLATDKGHCLIRTGRP